MKYEPDRHVFNYETLYGALVFQLCNLHGAVFSAYVCNIRARGLPHGPRRAHRRVGGLGCGSDSGC